MAEKIIDNAYRLTVCEEDRREMSVMLNNMDAQ